MNRPLSAWALVSLVGCQTPTERCNANPEDPACIPDAGTVNGLTYRTELLQQGDEWAEMSFGLCGHFERRVVWLLPDGAPADGFVVQQVDLEMSAACPIRPGSDLDWLDTCTDPPTVENLPPQCIENDAPFIDRGALRFWEAFPMTAGEIRYANVDIWALDHQAVAEGTARIAGSARFYTAAEMGDEHPEHPDSPFRTAPADVPGSGLADTLREPDFWAADERPTLDRRIDVSWQCCPAMITVLQEDTHDR